MVVSWSDIQNSPDSWEIEAQMSTNTRDEFSRDDFKCWDTARSNSDDKCYSGWQFLKGFNGEDRFRSDPTGKYPRASCRTAGNWFPMCATRNSSADRHCCENNGASGNPYIYCGTSFRGTDAPGCQNMYYNECKDNPFSNYCKNRCKDKCKTARQDYCNRDNATALSTECIDWCKENATSCTKLNSLTDCVRYGLCSDLKKCRFPNCSPQKITEIQALCKKRGIEFSTGQAISGCSPKAIKELEDECIKYGVSLESCSPLVLQDAKTNAIAQEQLQIQREVQQQSQQNYANTQNMIANMVGLQPTEFSNMETPISKDTEVKNDNTFIFVIIITIIILILLSISSSSLGFVLVY